MSPGDRVRFEGPLGSFFLREDSREADHLRRRLDRLRAGEEHARVRLRRGMKRRMLLYWGVRRLQDLYLARAARAVGARARRTSRFVPVLSEPAPEDDWTGPHRARARGDPRRLSRPRRLPGVRLRLGGDGRGRASRVPRARACAGRLLLRRLPPRAAAPEMVKLGGTDMKATLRLAAQLVLYVPLMALIGYFSTAPRFSIRRRRTRRWCACRSSTPRSARRPAASAAPRSWRSSRRTCAPRRIARASAPRCWSSSRSTASWCCAARCRPRG